MCVCVLFLFSLFLLKLFSIVYVYISLPFVVNKAYQNISPPGAITTTGWAKKVIPLVQCNVMYERYHFFGPPCMSGLVILGRKCTLAASRAAFVGITLKTGVVRVT